MSQNSRVGAVVRFIRKVSLLSLLTILKLFGLPSASQSGLIPDIGVPVITRGWVERRIPCTWPGKLPITISKVCQPEK